MAVAVSTSITALGLLAASLVAWWKSVTMEFKAASGKLYTILALAFTGLTALYLDKVNIT